MIDLYTWSTPNGRKVSILLEELNLEYKVHKINIGAGEQFAADFIDISPNSKIPAIVDGDGPNGKKTNIFESGAILIYLAEKYGKFYPSNPKHRLEVLQWIMFQMASIGPMFGQAHHFYRTADKYVEYGVKRYSTETVRLYGVLEERLKKSEFMSCEYSIADIATYPWVARHVWHRVELEKFPSVKRWFDQISLRPGVQRGMAV